MTVSKAKRTKTRPPQAPEPVIVPAAEQKQPSKQSRVIAMLRSKSGATAEQIMELTGWQKHSVRGFISGTVKKKLGVTVAVEKTEGGLVYRVVA